MDQPTTRTKARRTVLAILPKNGLGGRYAPVQDFLLSCKTSVADMRFSLATFLKTISAIAVVLAVIASYRHYYQVHRMAVTAAVANRMMWPGYELPEAASDVTYYVDWCGYSCEAEFQIDETAFLGWCEKRGWTPVRINEPTPYFEPICLPDDDRLVSEGYEFSIPYGRGVFNAERSRVAFWASTFP